MKTKIQNYPCKEFLSHQTTLISPKIIQENGIQICTTVQEEGEFIITFPYVYHCGFNHGFNCSENVNFANDDWIDYAFQSRQCTCINRETINLKKLIEMYYRFKYKRKRNEISDKNKKSRMIELPNMEVEEEKERKIIEFEIDHSKRWKNIQNVLNNMYNDFFAQNPFKEILAK